MDVLVCLEFLSDTRAAGVLVGLLIIFLTYQYSTRNYKYWKKRGVPFAKPYPFIGSVNGFIYKNFVDIEVERYNELGRIHGIYEGNKPVLTVAEPELLRNILVKDFHHFSNRRVFSTGDDILDQMLSALNGEDWKRVRTIVSPTFSTGKLKRVMSIFQDCSKTLIQNFKVASEKGESIDVLRTYGAFTMDVIASSAFSTKIDSHNDPDNEFAKRARGTFKLSFGLRFIFFIAMPTLMKKLGIGLFEPENMEFFKRVPLEIINERKRTGQKRNDFLQLLLDTADEVAEEEKGEDKSEDIIANYGDESANHAVFKNTTSKHLTQDELVAQCVIFFLAGYHTTSTTLSTTTYLLALNEDVQEKVFREITDVLNETNGELTYESIQKMKYLDNVISEVLRLYAPGLRLDRTAVSDYKLGETGITIPEGMLIGIPIYAMHRDPKLFPDPEKFDPDRFSPKEKEKMIPYSYLPFGAGPRNCIGMRFALLELKVCLVYVVSAFEIKKCSQTKVPLEYEKAGILQPKSIFLNMVPRDDSPLKTLITT